VSVKFRFGIMMFLQYAIWGAWAPVLAVYLMNDLHFDGVQVGLVFSLLPLATIISPFLGGQVADRWFATEKQEFGRIRVWVTIGWIAAGLLLSGWRTLGEAGTLPVLSGDTLFLAGVLSLIMGVQSFSLPHTPPKKEGVKPLAFLEALKLFRDKDFAVFMGIAFVVGTELEFYYILTAPFLQSPAIGVAQAMTPAVMTIAQVAEIFVMAFLLSYFLKKYGMRRTLAFGVIAWPIRYIIFAIGQPAWLVIASLALHGFCYVFFFVAAFIYVDKVAPPDIRASAQSMIAIVVLGLGRFLGSLFAGWVQRSFTSGGVTDWTSVFLVPCVLTVLCAAAFLLFFRGEKGKGAALPVAETAV
jgi:MFS family permease